MRRLGWMAAALTLGVAAAAVGAEPANRAPTALAASERSDTGVVNLNVASAEELERLPGIGPSKARAIVEHRKAHPFRKLDELTKVKGIGRKTLGKLRPHVTLTGPTTLVSEVRKK